MKRFGKIVSVAALVVVAVMCVVFASACGALTLPEGSYSGTYTYTSEGTTYGYVAKFDVDENNTIWDVTFEAPENATAPGVGMLPWDISKFTEQFSAEWAVDQLMKIVVEVKDNVPTGEIDYSETGKTLTVNATYSVGNAAAILAMQNAVNAELDA